MDELSFRHLFLLIETLPVVMWMNTEPIGRIFLETHGFDVISVEKIEKYLLEIMEILEAIRQQANRTSMFPFDSPIGLENFHPGILRN